MATSRVCLAAAIAVQVTVLAQTTPTLSTAGGDLTVLAQGQRHRIASVGEYAHAAVSPDGGYAVFYSAHEEPGIRCGAVRIAEQSAAWKVRELYSHPPSAYSGQCLPVWELVPMARAVWVLAAFSATAQQATEISLDGQPGKTWVVGGFCQVRRAGVAVLWERRASPVPSADGRQIEYHAMAIGERGERVTGLPLWELGALPPASAGDVQCFHLTGMSGPRSGPGR